MFKQAEEMTNLKKRHEQNLAEISKERQNSKTIYKTSANYKQTVKPGSKLWV